MEVRSNHSYFYLFKEERKATRVPHPFCLRPTTWICGFKLTQMTKWVKVGRQILMWVGSHLGISFLEVGSKAKRFWIAFLLSLKPRDYYWYNVSFRRLHSIKPTIDTHTPKVFLINNKLLFTIHTFNFFTFRSRCHPLHIQSFYPFPSLLYMIPAFSITPTFLSFQFFTIIPSHLALRLFQSFTSPSNLAFFLSILLTLFRYTFLSSLILSFQSLTVIPSYLALSFPFNP